VYDIFGLYQDYITTKCGQRTLKINPDHPLIAGLKDKVGSRKPK
jgi:hypothetical protein